MKKKRFFGLFATLFLTTLSLTSCKFSAIRGDNTDDPVIDNTEEQPKPSYVKKYEDYLHSLPAFDRMDENKIHVYFYDSEAEGYVIFNTLNDYFFLGDFTKNEEGIYSFTGELSANYFFDLVSLDDDFKEDATIEDLKKVIIKIEDDNSYKMYSHLDVDNLTLSEVENYSNYDQKYAFRHYNYDNELELTSKLDRYSSLLDLDLKDYFIDLFKKINNLEDASELYAVLDLPSTYLDTRVTRIKLNADNLTNKEVQLSLPSYLKEIGEGTFKGLTIQNEVTLPLYVTTIEKDAFKETSISTLYIRNGKIEFKPGSFLKTNIKTLVFSNFLNQNYDFFPFSELNARPVIHFGKSTTIYDSLSEALANEDDINTMMHLSEEGRNTLTNKNIFIIESEKTLFISPTLYKNESEDIRKVEDLVSYNDQSVTQYDISNFVCAHTFKLEQDLIIRGTVALGATLNTPAHPRQGYISGNYTALDLNGHNLIIENGGRLISYGRIYDSAATKGRIEVNKGGELQTNFVVDDFRGGTQCLYKYSMGESPFILYRLPYLEVETDIAYLGKLTSHCVLYAMSRHNSTSQTIIGTDGLIELTKDQGYITRSIVNTEEKYKETFDIYGDFKTNDMSIKVSGINVSTAGVHFPISKYLDINVRGDSVGTISNMLKVLPGANINFYDNSKVILEGEVTVYRKIEDTTTAMYPDYNDKDYPEAVINFYDSSSLEFKVDESSTECKTKLAGNINVYNKELFDYIRNSVNSNLLIDGYIYTTEGYSTGGNDASYKMLFDVKNHLKLKYFDENSVLTNHYEKYALYGIDYHYIDGNLVSMEVINRSNAILAKYTDTTWTIYVDGVEIETSLTKDEFTNQMIATNNKLYAIVNDVFSEVVEDESSHLYYAGGVTYIKIDEVFHEVNEVKKDLYIDSDGTYWFYGTEPTGTTRWLNVELFCEGNFIIYNKSQTSYGVGYYFDIETETWHKVDKFSDYRNGAFLLNNYYYIYVMELQKFVPTENKSGNTITYGTIRDLEDNFYIKVALDSYKAWLLVDSIDENKSLMTVTIDGEPQNYITTGSSSGQLSYRVTEITDLNNGILIVKTDTDVKHRFGSNIYSNLYFLTVDGWLLAYFNEADGNYYLSEDDIAVFAKDGESYVITQVAITTGISYLEALNLYGIQQTQELRYKSAELGETLTILGHEIQAYNYKANELIYDPYTSTYIEGVYDKAERMFNTIDGNKYAYFYDLKNVTTAVVPTANSKVWGKVETSSEDECIQTMQVPLKTTNENGETVYELSTFYGMMYWGASPYDQKTGKFSPEADYISYNETLHVYEILNTSKSSVLVRVGRYEDTLVALTYSRIELKITRFINANYSALGVPEWDEETQRWIAVPAE